MTNLNCCKEPWRSFDEGSKDELKSCRVVFRQNKQGLNRPTQFTMCSLNFQGRDATIADTEVSPGTFMRCPNEPKIRHFEQSTLAIITLRILHGIDRVNHDFTLSKFQLLDGYIKTNFTILPHIWNSQVLM